MNIKVKNYNSENYLPKFQEGGEMAAPAEAAPAEGAEGGAPAGGEDPMQQILQAAAQAVQTQDAQLALQVCQALVEMAGGGAPQEAPAEQPVYRKGGKLVGWIKK